jgi:ABC-2 type transport system ATP-binding protein
MPEAISHERPGATICVESVTRRFGRTTAVDDVSFQLGHGELVGFVGPNGAGKSTMLRMLATYLHPDVGRVTVCGHDTVREPLAVRSRVGYLPGDTPLYPEMRVDRFLAFVANAHGLRGPTLRERLGHVVEACALAEVLRKRVKECSTGFRKRIGLATALIHDPAVLLLDEPTHGLDPLQVLSFRELLAGLRSERAILLSSHVVSEVAHLADRVLILHAGRLLADGVLADLCARESLGERDLEGLFVRLVRRYEAERNGGPARRNSDG